LVLRLRGEARAEELVALLHEYFTAFDEITKRTASKKMKTRRRQLHVHRGAAGA